MNHGNGKLKLRLSFIVILLIQFIVNIHITAGFTEEINKKKVSEVNSLKAAKENAVKWLTKQIVPNSVVPQPSSVRKNFVLSYNLKDYSGDNKYLYGKSNLYDNAIAAIALTMCGDLSTSEAILSSVLNNMTVNNDLWFGYNTQNEWPDINDNDGAVVRTGASAWFGYAVVFYLERVSESKDEEKFSGNTAELLRKTELLAEAVLKRRVNDKNDLRYGFVTGGDNQYQLNYDYKNRKAMEDFITGTIEWTSTEHNIDTYFFLKGLYRVTGKDIYKAASSEISEALCRNWYNSIKQMARGRDKYNIDIIESLDCASWGSMFLRSAGFTEKADIALSTCNGYLAESGVYKGYRPYKNTLVYENQEINSRIYPDDPDKNWNDLPFFWHEGSLGVAMALIKAGRMDDAKKVIESVTAFQNPDGGIPYANISIPFQFSTEESVASAAWLVMTISAYENRTIRELFWR